MDRIPPHNREAEEAVLGSMLVDNDCINPIIQFLKPEHFYYAQNAEIYKAIKSVWANRQDVDLITVSDYLEKIQAQLDDNPIAVVGSLARNLPSASNAKSYANMILTYWNARELTSACYDCAEQVYNGESAEDARKSLYDNIEGLFQHGGESTISDASVLCSELVDELERITQNPGLTGWSTGDKHIDDATGGLMPGDYIGLAARSGGGKTTKALNILAHFALNDRRCLMFSMEMKRNKVMMKLCSDIGNVPFHLLKSGDLNDYQWAGVGNCVEKLKGSKLHIDDSSGLSIDDIERKARQLKAKYGSLELIVIDYIQRIKITGDSMYQELTKASNRLKDLFMELGCAGIVLAQLKKNSIGFPNASDLRETGAIENDSDLLIFLHTPSEDLKPHKGMLTAEIFNKVRFGEAGVKMLRNELEYQRFVCSDDDYQEPEGPIFN